MGFSTCAGLACHANKPQLHIGSRVRTLKTQERASDRFLKGSLKEAEQDEVYGWTDAIYFQVKNF